MIFISKIKENYQIKIDHIESLVEIYPKNDFSDSKETQSKISQSV
jgi:hypothetical protein